MRPPAQNILDALIASTSPGDELTLDTIGAALGTEAVSSVEIDELFAALEAAGRHVGSAAADTTAHLRAVLPAARILGKSLGRLPRPDEIAAATRLDLSSVRAALLLAQIMGR